MQETLPIAGPMLGAAITIVGLLISWVVWRRKGAASGLRGMAWSLLPLAAGLLGLMAVIWRAVSDIVGILGGLLFNPVVWAGVAVAGLAVVLFIVSGFLRNRSGAAKAKDKGKTKSAKGGGAVPDAGAAAGIGGGAQAPAAGDAAGASGGASGKSAGKKAAGGDDDFGDIEDLLRKHGIE